jgi:hypothetical protein
MLQVFGEMYRDGRLPPTTRRSSSNGGGRHPRSGAGVRQTGLPGPLERRAWRQILSDLAQIKVYKKDDAPPKCVKPVRSIIIIFIIAQAFGDTRSEEEMTIVDMIAIVFFFLLRPEEYTGTVSDDTIFKLHDVDLYIQGRKLDVLASSEADLK